SLSQTDPNQSSLVPPHCDAAIICESLIPSRHLFCSNEGSDEAATANRSTRRYGGLAVRCARSTSWQNLSRRVRICPEPASFKPLQDLYEKVMRIRIPMSVPGSLRIPKVGPLVGYGPNLLAGFRLAATYADRILKGANPSDLPVEQP